MTARDEREEKRIRRYINYNPCPDSKRRKNVTCPRCRKVWESPDAARRRFCESCQEYRDTHRLSSVAAARKAVLVPGGKRRG